METVMLVVGVKESFGLRLELRKRDGRMRDV